MAGKDGKNDSVISEHKLFVHIILFASLYLAYLVLKPYLTPIIFGIVFASLSMPLKRFFDRKTKGRQTLSAFLTVFTVAVAIAIPLIFLSAAVVAEGVRSIEKARAWLQFSSIEELVANERIAGASVWIKERLPFLGDVDLAQKLADYGQAMTQKLLAQSANIATDIIGVSISAFMLFFVMFYLLVNGQELLEDLKDLIPIDNGQLDIIAQKVREMAKSVFVGSFLTAMAQGVVGGVGLALAGIPGLFWGAVMAVASLIPVVGTALVWVPAVIFLLITNQWQSGLFLGVWCAVLVGSVDNFLRPFLMQGNGVLSPFFVFLSVMGGIQLFGITGVLFGPLILTFTTAILSIYKAEFTG